MRDKRQFPATAVTPPDRERDCDVWIGCYRDEVYNEASPMAGVVGCWSGSTEAVRQEPLTASSMGWGDLDIDQQEVARMAHAAEVERSKSKPAKGWDG